MTVTTSELRQQWDECLRLLDRDRVRERQVQSTDYYNAQGRMVSLLWANAAEIIAALERDQEAFGPMPDDLTALLRREIDEWWSGTSVQDRYGPAWMGALAARLAEVAAGHYESWDGLMSILDRHYPADVQVLCDENSPDPGPRIVALIRHLDAARKAESETVALLRELMYWVDTCHRLGVPLDPDGPVGAQLRAYLARRKEQS